MDTLEHQLRWSSRRRAAGTFLLVLIAIAVPAAIGWILYEHYKWLVIVMTEAALAYALVASLSRMTPPPRPTRPVHSFNN